MKKIKMLIAFGTGVLLSFASMFNAFALNTKISFSDPTASVGSEVNLVMKVSSVDGSNLGESFIELKYNSELLEFVSGTNAQKASDGLVKVAGKAGDSPLEYVYDLKFNALKAGETTIIVENWGIHDTENKMATLDHRGTSKVTITEAQAGAETTTETNATVTETVATNDQSTEVVTGEVPDGTAMENGITVEGQNYELLADFDASLLPATFVKQEYNYKGQVVSAGVQPDNPAKLMYLLTNDGSGNLFFYDESHDAWSKFINFTIASKSITVVPTTSDVTPPAGFKETVLGISGNMVKGYIWESDTQHNYAIIYGMNAEGQRHFYRYDIQEKTIQRYFEDPNIRGNTADYTDTVTYYRNLQKAYEQRGTKLYIATGVALVLLLALLGLLLKLFVLDRKEEEERKERKRIRDKEVALEKEAARKEIESLTANLPSDKMVDSEGALSADSSKATSKLNSEKEKVKRSTKISNSETKLPSGKQKKGDYKHGVSSGQKKTHLEGTSPKNKKKRHSYETVKLEEIENLDEVEELNSSNTNFIATAEEMESLYPDTKEEEQADEISAILNEKEENADKKEMHDGTEDAFLFDNDTSLTVSFVDDKKEEISDKIASEDTSKKNKQTDTVKDKKYDTGGAEREDEKFPGLINIINMNFQNEYYEDEDDFSKEDMDEITDKLNKNLGIDENVLELETLEENLVKKYDNQVIETALDESAKTSVDEFVIPIDEKDFKKAVKSEEKQNTFSKFDTQEIDR